MHTPPLCVARPHGENSHTLCASSRNILTPYVNQKGKFSHPTCIIKGNSPSLCACTRHPSQKFSHLMRIIRGNSHILHALRRKILPAYAHPADIHDRNSHNLCNVCKYAVFVCCTTPYGIFPHPMCIIKGNSDILCAFWHPMCNLTPYAHAGDTIHRNSHTLYSLRTHAASICCIITKHENIPLCCM